MDAIVNAANTSLQMGGGVCGAIFSAAGADSLQAACENLGPIKTGEAVITNGFKLPAKYIIHAAGPVYRDGKHGEEALLRNCYTNALNLAVKHNCESIAFPLISSGIFGYPKAEALRVATAAIRDFLSEHDIDVSLVVYDKAAFALSEELLGNVESYIDEHYVDARESFYCRRKLLSVEMDALAERSFMGAIAPPRPSDETAVIKKTRSSAPQAPAGAAHLAEAKLADMVGNLDEPFTATLLRLIDATGKKDAEIYRRANIDRRLFSKIRSNAHYAPSKPTVLAFAVALELSIDQTEDLLERAGFALSHSRKFDVIVEYFITSRRFDIFEINEVLFSYDQQLLGG